MPTVSIASSLGIAEFIEGLERILGRRIARRAPRAQTQTAARRPAATLLSVRASWGNVGTLPLSPLFSPAAILPGEDNGRGNYENCDKPSAKRNHKQGIL
jgi:hypothetical protein